ncbi:hypothetical protein GCM10008904_13130 [Paraclostridium ghonii]|uniref:Uncharacterized protein n=1 Tax=Paraclostridium ghonii TaxID=29358 RepID=A0ABU0N393_9FIRM|nr:hypothetical protein [Paeniclostridium ghonii]MDQ0557595.1 hypothetical protein [Paeniclostridium ghonii]
MAKSYILKEDYDKSYKDKNNFIWNYYSHKKMKELFSKDYKKSIKVIGEVVSNNEYRREGIEYEGNELSIGNIGTNNKRNRKVVGYIECGENEYVAVVKSNWTRIVVILVAILALLFGLIAMKNSGPKLDSAAKDYVANIQRPADWDSSKIAIPGFNEIKAKYGEGAAYVALWNPMDNPVYFQYDVIIDQTGKSILKTNLIPPGKAVTKIPISKSLKPGTYDITLKVNTYSLDDHTKPMNGGEVKQKLVIVE